MHECVGPDMAENGAFDEQKTAKEEQLSRGNGNRGGNREKNSTREETPNLRGPERERGKKN